MDAAFSRAVLSEREGKNKNANRRRLFTKEMHESGLAVLKQLRKLASDGELDEPISFLEQVGARFVGMNGREILAILIKDDSSGQPGVVASGKPW
jgi:hypothetical protein